MSDDRQEFEAWFRTKVTGVSLDRYQDGYRLLLPQYSWLAWQARQPEIDGLRETNARLNRRCQELESVIAKKGEASWWASKEYDRGYQAGRDNSTELRRFQTIAQKHGERNAKLKADVERLRKLLSDLAESAADFTADQSRAPDPRCGIVQPVDVEQCECLSQAVRVAFAELEADGKEVSGE